MKKYIILGTFFNMGGGQIYTRNKTVYLKEKGWDVDVYTGRYGKLYLKEMEEYIDNYIPEINYFPFYTRNEIVNNTLDRIAERCIGYDEIVIESHKQPMALWGELLAKRINGKHVFFDLDEDFVKFDKWYYEFLDFKHSRRELAGIVPDSLDKMFKGFKVITEENNYNLRFLCGNSIENVHVDIIDNTEKGDLCLGIISRLNKDYMMTLMSEIATFLKHNDQIMCTIFLVGDADDKSISERLASYVKDIPNAKLHLLGYLSPIPRSLIDKVDFFIGTSGSAVLTANEGKITIAVDTMTCEPIGIMNYDVKNTDIFSSGKCRYKSVSEYLEYMYYKANSNQIVDQIKRNTLKDNSDYMIEFDNHMEFINASNQQKEYFEFDNIDIMNKILFGIINRIGINNAKKLKKVVKKG